MIYIVEDDENIGQMECYALKNSGFGTELFEDSESFFSAVARRLPTLVILDLMLPGEDGLTILRRLRDSAETRKIPIIIVSAKSGEADAVRGLDSGADDYITKPFGVSELISRVKAVLRRTDGAAPNNYSVGGISLDDGQLKTARSFFGFTQRKTPEASLLREFFSKPFSQGTMSIFPPTMNRDSIRSKVLGR